MTAANPLDPFAHDGDSTGILLCHGFTGSPASMRPWADRFAEVGYTVRLPLLPGHGTTHHELAQTTWHDWYAAALQSARDLLQRCDRVFVCGLSMGGTLALRLAEELGDDLRGVILVNPSVLTADRRAPFARYLRFVMPTIPAIGDDIKRPGIQEHAYGRVPVRAFASLQDLWSVVRRDIARVTQPTLMFVSEVDHVVEAANAHWLREHLPAAQSVTLRDSYHVATLDNDAEVIFARSLEFVRSH